MGKYSERAGIEVEEKMRFSAVLLERDMGHGRKLRKVVDTDTGEIIIKQNQGSIAHVFSTGANAVITEVMLSREKAENSPAEHVFVKHPVTGEAIYDFWHNPEKQTKKKDKAPKHTGGKPGYIKAFQGDVWYKLSDSEAGALIKLSFSADWRTGMLTDKHTKRPLGAEEMQKILGYKSLDTLKSRLKRFAEIKAITQDAEGRFFISREFIQRG